MEIIVIFEEIRSKYYYFCLFRLGSIEIPLGMDSCVLVHFGTFCVKLHFSKSTPGDLTSEHGKYSDLL